MEPEEHDRTLALTSHVPHLVAAALVSLLKSELLPLAATGFRDTTRVAAGDPALWTGIMLQNREPVLAGLQLLGESLDRYREALTIKQNGKPLKMLWQRSAFSRGRI